MTTPTRRDLRRSQTIDEIVGIAIDVMTEEGVAGLSLSEVARRLGVRPPSLYKYFPSRMALFDRLFHDGHQHYFDEFRAGAQTADPGLPALVAGLEAGGRWAMRNQALAQLLFWRPVPKFEPSIESFAPALAVVEDIKQMLAEAVDRGQVAPAAASLEAMSLLSILVTGIVSQQLANAPDEPFESGRFTRLAPHVFAMFRAHYPPVIGGPQAPASGLLARNSVDGGRHDLDGIGVAQAVLTAE